MHWSLIIFCYNEEDTIAEVIRASHQFLQKNGNTESEIIVVDDGSTDKSLEICQQLSTVIPQLKVIRHPENMGIGAALNTGYDHAGGEYICAIPGDGQFNISELNAIQPFNTSEYVAFYRLEKQYSPYRALLTWGNNFFNNKCLHIPIQDVNWIKIYRKEQLRSISRELSSSLVESEIVGKLTKKGIQPIEIQSVYHPRKGGISRGGNWRTLHKALKETILLYRVVNKKK